jgi:cell division protein FtsB
MTSSVSTHDSRRTATITLKVVMLLSGVLTVIFVISFVFSDRGISELQRSRRRVDALRTDIRSLEMENARLRNDIESVKRSTFAVERIAREDLGMARKGETVYMLPARPPTAKPGSSR